MWFFYVVSTKIRGRIFYTVGDLNISFQRTAGGSESPSAETWRDLAGKSVGVSFDSKLEPENFLIALRWKGCGDLSFLKLELRFRLREGYFAVLTSFRDRWLLVECQCWDWLLLSDFQSKLRFMAKISGSAAKPKKEHLVLARATGANSANPRFV